MDIPVAKAVVGVGARVFKTTSDFVPPVTGAFPFVRLTSSDHGRGRYAFALCFSGYLVGSFWARRALGGGREIESAPFPIGNRVGHGEHILTTTADYFMAEALKSRYCVRFLRACASSLRQISAF